MKTMRARNLGLGLALVFGFVGGCTEQVDDQQEADLIKEVERERLRALVQADLEIADRLHADEFQLITPTAGEFNKKSYLGPLASGHKSKSDNWL